MSHLAKPGALLWLTDTVLTQLGQWRFIKGPEARGMELVVINPGFVVGPTLSANRGTSLDMCTRFLNRQIPAILGAFPLGLQSIKVRRNDFLSGW
jgi:hypothetical protein